MKKISLLIISVICFTTTYSQSDFKADTTVGSAPCVITFEEHSGSGISWMWDFGDGEHDYGFNNPVTHKYTKAGVYTVTLIVTKLDYSNDTVVKKDYITIVGDNSIVENEWENIHFYPNPCHTTLKITSNQTFSTYSIKDVNGKECIPTSVFTDCIDVSILAKGIYFIVLQNKKKNVVQKFIVE